MQIIASLEVGEAGELLEHLKKEGIPVEVRTVTQDSGLEISEIMVEDSYYEPGCDVVEAWDAARIAESKKRSKAYCRKCGSRQLDTIPHDRLGYIYRCKACGYEFAT